MTRYRSKQPIGPRAHMRRHERLAHHRTHHRIHIRQPIEDAGAIGARWFVTLPAFIVRWWWQLADYTILPTILAAYCLWAGIPLVFAVAPAAVWVGYVAWTVHAGYVLPPLARFSNDRILSRFAKSIERFVQPPISLKRVLANHGHVRRFLASPPMGNTTGQVIALRDVLQVGLGQRITVKASGPADVVISVHLQDLLAKATAYQPNEAADPTKLRGALDEDGAWITYDLNGFKQLVFGTTGAGKSIYLNGQMPQYAALVQAGLAHLWLIDPESGVELGDWYPFATHLARTPGEGVNLLAAYVAHHTTTVERMDTLGVRSLPISREHPAQILVVDELGELARYGDRKTQTATLELIHAASARGRKSGHVMIAATQRLAADIVPREITNNFTHRLGLRTFTRNEGNIGFPDGTVGQFKIDLSAISPRHPGRGVWYDGETFRDCRAPLITTPQIHAEVQRLMWLPPSPQRPPIAPQKALGRPQGRPVAVPHPSIEGQPQREEGTPSVAAPMTAAEKRQRVAEIVEAAGPVGVSTRQLGTALGLSADGLKRTLQGLQRDGLIVTRAGRWHWAADSNVTPLRRQA